MLAAPSTYWDRATATDNTTVCELENGICGEGSEAADWDAILKATKSGVYLFTFSGSEYMLVAAPVSASFILESENQAENTAHYMENITHYILSVVLKKDVFLPVDDMTKIIRGSSKQILITTGLAAAVTLVAVVMAVYLVSETITRPIVKMTRAAKNIAESGAKTNVFGQAAREWGRGPSDSMGGARGATCWDYLLCRGDDEIRTLAREFRLMINGLGRRGSVARATGLENSSGYVINPLTASLDDGADDIPGVSQHRPFAPAIESS